MADEYLPEGACCARCEFSELVRSGERSIQRQRICKRFPPGPVAVPVTHSGQSGLAVQAIFPPVTDATVCFEFQEAEAAGEGAGDGIEPTALL